MTPEPVAQRPVAVDSVPETRVVFQQTIEGLFQRGLGTRVTDRCRATTATAAPTG